MKRPTLFLCIALVVGSTLLPFAVRAAGVHTYHRQVEVAVERLGSIAFPVSCAPTVRTGFNRGVALLHDFWYDEARSQFEKILKTDPSCAIAHWGVAMSVFHQIWDRPDDATSALAWKELKAAQLHLAKSARERRYIAALSDFFRPSGSDYQSRIENYSEAMAKLARDYPDDIDAGAFYALSVLAATAPNDTSLKHAHSAMSVLNALYAKHPEHPGVVHYIIHACDTPSLAADGLVAAVHYGDIAATAPHAVHMPGHIFSRLGMWREDIESNAKSVLASRAAEARGQSGSMDQFHSDDFLLYAYLQSGQDTLARQVVGDSAAAVSHFEGMSNMADHYMTGMLPYYRTKLPIFYALEMRDWESAGALEAIRDAPPESQTLVYWARAIADGHLKHAAQARAELAAYESLMEQVKKGRHAYLADATQAKIERGEMRAWIAFAEGNGVEAEKQMRGSADLQDKVGQDEVDIPAREMLGDLLLEFGRPQDALHEYRQSLQLSPNRFNGLFNAGLAAETLADRAAAQGYYSTLLKFANNGRDSSRSEIKHAKEFVALVDSESE